MQLNHTIRALRGRIFFTRTLFTGGLVVASLLAVWASPIALRAQGLFSPAYIVNGDAVTYFELDQRIRFMELLRLPGNPEKVAPEELIKDRLKLAAMREVGIEANEEDVVAGMEEFAKRVNLSLEEFVKALEQEGVSRETLHDFVAMQRGWGTYVASRFLGQARPSDAEIDRALSLGDRGGGLQVLLSEIIIPVTPQTFDAVSAEADRIALSETFEAFSAEAARFSATDSRNNGGRLDWLAINNLPPALQPQIMALTPGEVTSPIPVPNAIALFQMRDIRETAPPTPRYSEIEYAILYLGGGRSPETLAQAQRIAQDSDTCNDLYTQALGQPPEVLFRESRAPGKIPQDVALELAHLDKGEISTSLTTRDGKLMLLMLCDRKAYVSDEELREQVAVGLTNQRLGALSESFLAQKLAEAHIVEK